MSGKQKEQSTKVEGWEPAQDILEHTTLPGIQDYADRYGDGQGLYQGTQLADENPLITQAQNMTLLGLPEFQQQLMGNVDVLEGFLDYDPNSTQNQASRQALQDNVQYAFDSSIRPGIEDRSTLHGQFGGPQSAVAMGAATGPLSRALADAEVNLMNADRNRAYGAMGQAPGIIASQLLGPQVMGDIGIQRQQRDQYELADQIQQFEGGRRADLQSLIEQQGLLSPLTGIGGQTTAQLPGTSPLQGALGGAAVGNSIAPGGWGAAGGAFIGAIGSYL